MNNIENMESRMGNKNAFVTGASKGLGEQISLKLLDRGVKVIGASRSGPPESFGHFIDQNLADYELGDLSTAGEEIVRRIHEKHQGYEIFVNNAGAFSPDYFINLSPEAIRKDIELDLLTPLILHNSWINSYNNKSYEYRKPEIFVNICSISSIYAWPGGTAYQAAKTGLAAALYGLRSMQKYLQDQETTENKQTLGAAAELNTRVIAIYPDNVATGLISRAQTNSVYQVHGAALPTNIVVDTVIKSIEGNGMYGQFDDIAILINPKEASNGQVMPGAYAAFLPIDSETHRPSFANRQLEKIADEDDLIGKSNY